MEIELSKLEYFWNSKGDMECEDCGGWVGWFYTEKPKGGYCCTKCGRFQEDEE